MRYAECMPNAAELASLANLGLPFTPGGEDSLTAVPGSVSSASGRDPCKVISSGATHPTPGTGRSGDCPASAHPSEVGLQDREVEYVSMAKLLPDNLELARRSGEAQRSA